MSAEEQKTSWPGWKTVQLIGRGSFGAVYEIQRDVLGDIEKAALKVISIPQNSSDIDELYGDGYDEESITSTFQSHLKSIVAEYSLMRKMNGSANIVNCDDIRYVQHDDGIGWDIFIKMELLTPLAKALPSEVAEETVINIAEDMCAALELCKKHEIVHRDIKPQNIFVSPNGDYKLGDFGIAKTVEKTMGGTKIGTYKYMAPEVYNNQPYGSAADIYSLGLVLYWLLNERRMPFLPLPPEKLKAGMDETARQRRLSGEPLPAPAHGSDTLKQIVLKACAPNPKDRFASATEMHEALRQLSDNGISAPTPNPEPTPEQPAPTPVPISTPEQKPAPEPVSNPAPKPGPVWVSQSESSEEEFRDYERKEKRKVFWIVVALLCVIAIVFVLVLRGGNRDSGAERPSQSKEPTVTQTQPGVQSETRGVKSIAVSSKPEKISYYVGEMLDPSGLTLTVTYTDGSTKMITEGFTFYPTTFDGAGEQSVAVIYGGKVTSIFVTIDAYAPTKDEINEAKRQLRIVEDYEAEYTTYSYAELQSMYDDFINAGNTVVPDSVVCYSDLGPTITKFDNNAEVYFFYTDRYYSFWADYYDESRSFIYRDIYRIVIDGSFHTGIPPYSIWEEESSHNKIFSVNTEKGHYHCLPRANGGGAFPVIFYCADYVDEIAARLILTADYLS